MATYKILYWQEIPSQIKVEDDTDDVTVQMPDRFQEQASAAFATPMIVHFTIVLLLAAVQTAPWREIGPVEIIWALLGLGGIVYEIIVAQRMRAQKR